MRWSDLKKTVPAKETVEVANEDTPRHNAEDAVIVGAGGPTDAGWHSASDGIGCMKEGQYKHVRKITLPMNNTPDHFAVGGLLHAGRATWFGAKFAMDEASKQQVFSAMQEAEDSFELPVSTAAIQAAHKYMKEYMEHWSLRPKPQPVAAEYLVGPAPLEKGDPFPLWRTARLDDVSYYSEAGGLAIGEAKTTSASINDCVNQYTLHGQPILQVILWNTSEQGAAKHGPLKGFVLDIIKKGYGKDKSQFARHFIEVTPRTIEWYVRNMQAYLRRYASTDWNSDVERNIQFCTRMVGRARMACEYRDLCMHGKTAAGNYVLKDGSALSSWKPSLGKETEPWD